MGSTIGHACLIRCIGINNVISIEQMVQGIHHCLPYETISRFFEFGIWQRCLEAGMHSCVISTTFLGCLRQTIWQCRLLLGCVAIEL